MLRLLKEKGVSLAVTIGCALLLSPAWALANEAAAAMPTTDGAGWWKWPLILLVVTFVMGIIAVLGGVGGGVLFVPIIGGFFPFHLDFVRGAGLLVALCGSLAAGPGLLKANLASLRLSVPVALIASTMAIVGAMVGLALPTHIVQLALGGTILGIVVIMLTAKKSTIPDVPQADNLSSALRICGIYHEPTMNQDINWKIHRTIPGLLTFIIIGFMAGMF
ncbi:MAG: TSUP family transporter, partial [Desulfobulbaceae bacterium]|nr:TSUP family transporter [Desulfobulbaceae bacterium]